MKVIKPKIIDILNDMRLEGCSYLGGTDCNCCEAKFFETCYNKKKQFLTKTELTEEEKEENRIHNEKTWNEINKTIEEIFEGKYIWN